MPIFKALELSTAYMKSTDADILKGYMVDQEEGRFRPEGGNLIVDPIGNYGWTINLGQIQNKDTEATFLQALAEEGFSEAFINILKHGAGQGLDAVRFDCDVDDIEPGFPRFNWENGDEVEEDVEDAAPTM